MTLAHVSDVTLHRTDTQRVTKWPEMQCEMARFTTRADMSRAAMTAARPRDEAILRMQKSITKAVILDILSVVIRTRERRC